MTEHLQLIDIPHYAEAHSWILDDCKRFRRLQHALLNLYVDEPWLKRLKRDAKESLLRKHGIILSNGDSEYEFDHNIWRVVILYVIKYHPHLSAKNEVKGRRGFIHLREKNAGRALPGPDWLPDLPAVYVVDEMQWEATREYYPKGNS